MSLLFVMASLIDCSCPVPLGGQECETTTGIAELYWTPYENLDAIAFAASANTCCPEGEITSFGVDAAAPDGLLQPINFVKQDDDSGAVFSFEDSFEGGNKVRNRTLLFQVNSDNPDEECAIDSLIGREIAFIFKLKNGKWKALNWSGGARVTSNTGDSNTSYKTVTLTGRVNDRDLYISFTDGGAWADANLIPNSVDPLNGLINA